MASAASIEILVTCPVCYETYQDPQILNCQHVLCAKCLKSVMKNRKDVPCPECRTKTPLTDVKKDLNKQMLLDAVQKQNDEMTSDEEAENTSSSDGSVNLSLIESCEICESEAMIWLCQICDKLMCNQCEKAHSSFPALKDHNIELIEDTVKNNHAQLEKILDGFELARKRAEDMLVNSKQCCINFNNRQKENVVLINKQREGLKQAIDVFHDQLLSDVYFSFREIGDLLETSKSGLLGIVERCSVKMKATNQYINTDNIRLLIKSGETCAKDMSDSLQEIHTQIEKNQIISSAKDISIKCVKDINFSDFTSVVVEKTKVDLGKLDIQTRSFDGLYEKHISLEIIQDVVLEYWPKRIHIVGDKLWCTSESGVHIYDKNCKNAKYVELESVTCAKSVVRSHIGSIVAACNNDGGLAEFDMNGKKKTILSEGSFGDVIPFNGKLFALELKQNKVYVFEYQNGLWCLDTRFDCGLCSYNYDTIGVNKDSVFVCNWISEITRKYDHNGTYLEKYNTFSRAKLCDVDDNGAALLAYFLLQSFYVLKEDGKRIKLNVKGALDSPSDAVISEDCNVIWAITRAFGIHKLIKLTKSSL